MIDTLILAGGGMNGFYFIGILHMLFQKNVINLKNLKHILGCSAGSILGFLINIGFSINAIEKICVNINTNNLLELNNNISSIEDIFIEHGLFNINLKDLSKILYYKYNVTNITFKELYDKTNIELTIKVFNYTIKTSI